ncbi:hypothetical protein GLAREA_05517 [Glarea lozoyensis ATCC 20868]|uniref:Uncharacterized protein n=1 Tax=Glarea lozoyensis (strain ATCC 20868 / MF5171) TaxID=1116229 RepID=S3DGC1_GLAL2|nr:uncharacterized protein GLAREA_05517 [Glarea lozoyensis ATCC 20868]EPE36179.1 hypothetical protein GLAREA_05517 [Glarea lozoyensis ATCC 20868]
MSETEVKPQFQSDFEEFDTPTQRTKAPVSRILNSVRLGLTLLALLSSIVIVGTSSHTLGTFKSTHLGDEFLLPLWPADFDLRPTTALVACGVFIIFFSALSLVASSVPAIRNKTLIHTIISFIAPTVGLIAGLVGTSFFYGVNSSSTTHSLQSWSCQWSAIDMNMKPHFRTLCKESKTALYLMVMMIPLQVIVMSLVAFGAVAEKKQRQIVVHERKGSPAMS